MTREQNLSTVYPTTTSASEIVSSVRISEVWRALGGGSLRKCRGCAFWRPKADSWSVAIDDSKGTWFDHRDSTGGGILDLIQHVLHCTRQDALKWLADFTGLKLDNRPLTPQDRTRIEHAKHEAEDLTLWRRVALLTLRSWRNYFWDAARNAEKWLRTHATGPDDLDDPKAAAALRCVSQGERLGDTLNDAVNDLSSLHPEAVRKLRVGVSGLEVVR
jgi:hypothetical protein